MGRQEQEEGFAEVEGWEGWTSSSRERVQGVRDKGDRHMEPEKETAGGGGGRGGALGVTGNHRKTQQEIQSHETGRNRHWETETIDRQRHRDTQSERDIVPEYLYNLRVLGRARRSEGGQSDPVPGGHRDGNWGWAGVGCAIPPPYLGHAIPHDPGGGGPGAPPARRLERARVTAPLTAQAQLLQPGGEQGAGRPRPRPALPSSCRRRRHCPRTAG